MISITNIEEEVEGRLRKMRGQVAHNFRVGTSIINKRDEKRIDLLKSFGIHNSRDLWYLASTGIVVVYTIAGI